MELLKINGHFSEFSEDRKTRKTKVLQFGEGNFLRAFVDWMVQRMNDEADFNSNVTVVQPIENGMVNILDEQEGLYTLYLRGIRDGEAVSEQMLIDCITKCISPYTDFEKFLDEAKNPDLRFIVSNTTEAGICFDTDDIPVNTTAKTFPGKVTQLLLQRYKTFGGDASKGFVFLPCELIDKNGEQLKNAILRYCDLWALDQEFKEWIVKTNTFCNTLVDRIVPGYPKDRIEKIQDELGYIDNLIVEGEQFHLWVIEGPEQLANELPVEKAGLNVKFVEDLTPYRTRKVRILNGAHTAMVPVAYLAGLRTVKETVEDENLGEFVREVIFDEIIPTLKMDQNELEAFANDVLDRFKNPFVKHYLSSIALNSFSKYETRVLPTLLEYHKMKGEFPQGLLKSLACLIKFYSGEADGEQIPVNDDPEIVRFMDKLWKEYDGSITSYNKLVNSVLSLKKVWKQNLNDVEGLAENLCQLDATCKKITA